MLRRCARVLSQLPPLPAGSSASSAVVPLASSGPSSSPVLAPSPIRVVVCTLIPGGGCMPAAMAVLGFKPYQFFHAIRHGRHQTHPQVWAATVLKSQAIPAAILEGTDCLVGPPGASAVVQLLASHPTLRVILVQETDKETLGPRLHESIQAFYDAIPKRMAPQARNLVDLLYPNQTARVSAASLAAYEDVLLERVPREQLLVYTHGDGWEPLCDFLEVDLPEETVPFPAYDDGTAELATSAARTTAIWRWSLVFYFICTLAVFQFVRSAVQEHVLWLSGVICGLKDQQAEQQALYAAKGVQGLIDHGRQIVLARLRETSPDVYRPSEAQQQAAVRTGQQGPSPS